MSLKIVHISDVHIRNLKYHEEYRRVFEDLYRHIAEIKPDIVINTGDTAHTKTQISPEFVEMTSEHIRKVSALAPYHILLGNHDMNLMNPDRQDAITPVVDSIKSSNVFLHKKSGLCHSIVKDGTTYNIWAFSLADTDNYPTPESWKSKHESGEVNIGLFHGSVSTCVTDSNWRMTHVEHDLSIFDGLDFALLGDIHKQQFFKERTIAYAGSLIQQNFGEDIGKGFLVWELGAKGKPHSVNSFHLKGSRAFHTVRLSDDLSIPDVKIEEDSRVRIVPPRSLTLVEQKEVEKQVKKKFNPHDIITLSASNIGEQKVNVGKKSSDVENLRQVSVQEKLIRDFLKGDKLVESVMNKILDMNRRYQIHIDQEDNGARNISWALKKLAWSNLFNYGEGNIIDFSRIEGLTGIFAPNASGKSNLIDIILETCFDATTKGVNKNIFLVNDNKELATAIAEIRANDEEYEIERQIEKIKYGQRNSDKVKEWGKTSVSFSIVDRDGVKEPLVGISRPETEASIRQKLGSFDDFMLTSLLAQWNPMDIIGAKETKRKEIIFRFLDLDIFGQKALMAKEEAREFYKKLEDLDDMGLEEAIKKYDLTVRMHEGLLKEKKEMLTSLNERIHNIDETILNLGSQRSKIDNIQKQDWHSKIEKVSDEINKQTEKLDEVNESKFEVLLHLEKLKKLESKFDVKTFEESEKEFRQKTEKVKMLENVIHAKLSIKQSHEKNISLLEEVPCGDKFPSCKFLENAFQSKRMLSDVTAELERLTDELKETENEAKLLIPSVDKLNKFRSFMGEKATYQSKYDNYNLQSENMKMKIEQLSSEKKSLADQIQKYNENETAIKNNEMINDKISVLNAQKKGIKDNVTSHLNEISSLDRELGSEHGILSKLNEQWSQLKELKETCSAYEHYIRTMGKDGIPYHILTQKLPLINEEINKILSNVADFGIFLEHDVEEQSIRFFIQYGQYKGRLLELGSGAEKFLASIAIRNALMNISILPKTNMLIIDEGFGKLDPKNLESIQKMFEYLRTVFDHIIVISHLDTMKDMVDNMIEITTDEEGYAHVDIG